jgi:hypothetical protein
MENILCAQFDDLKSAANAAEDLRAAGVGTGDIEQFVLNAPGQHDRHPIGGDKEAKDGDEGAAAGASLGGVAGLVVGAAAIPVAGPFAAAAGLAAGAYAGSLAGAVNSMGDPDDDASSRYRPAGVRVAVHLAAPELRGPVLQAFGLHKARSIEQAEGNWSDGSWQDFDPLSTPHWIVPPPQ